MAEKPQDLVQTVPLPSPLLSPLNSGKQLVVIFKASNTCYSCTHLFSADLKSLLKQTKASSCLFVVFSHTSNLFCFLQRNPITKTSKNKLKITGCCTHSDPSFHKKAINALASSLSHSPSVTAQRSPYAMRLHPWRLSTLLNT